MEAVKEIIEEYGIESIGTAELRINGEARKEYDVFDIDDLGLFADKGLVVAFLMNDSELLVGELLDVDTDDCRMVLKSDKYTVGYLYNIFQWFMIVS